MTEKVLRTGIEFMEQKRMVERKLAALDLIDKKSVSVCLSYYCDGSWNNSGVIPQEIRQSLIASLRDNYEGQLQQIDRAHRGLEHVG